MDKQKLMPKAAQPVNRITTGQLPVELAELSEAALQLHGDDTLSASVLSSLSSADLLRMMRAGSDPVLSIPSVPGAPTYVPPISYGTPTYSDPVLSIPSVPGAPTYVPRISYGTPTYSDPVMSMPMY